MRIICTTIEFDHRSVGVLWHICVCTNRVEHARRLKDFELDDGTRVHGIVGEVRKLHFLQAQEEELKRVHDEEGGAMGEAFAI